MSQGNRSQGALAQSASRIRLSLLALAVLGVAALLGATDEHSVPSAPVELARPVGELARACSVSQEGALEKARALELSADASWERVPFEVGESPLAVLTIAEANACFRLAGEREGAQRSLAKREVYDAELMRRWARAQLGLELARRRADARAMRKAVAELLSLSRFTAGHPYRDRLKQLDRLAEAQLLAEKAGQD